MLPRGEDVARGALRVSGLSVHFGGLVALSEVSLDISAGEVLGVIGPNGAGKTTLFNVICGFVAPREGDVLWRGHSLRRTPTHRRASLGIARTLQGVGLFPALSVLENVMAGADHRRRSGLLSGLLGLPRADRDESELRAIASTMLERLDLAEVAQRLPDSLPYALQKRVALARALVCEPQLLMLDEPAAGLDSGDIARLRELISELKGSMAVMLVEHRIDVVTELCDRVAVLDFGRLIASGPPEAIKSDPKVLEAYLGAEQPYA
ncbi:MAG: ABC transporter ATP-binding protein [Solirubrobacteraceae bacterium]|nr:MAG: ABC transporter ATP-binding protein [Solirubrobacterales bacterium]